ncbi:hypothetical protein [Epilithonimonas lactis]|uniref:Uncharacterized protein n=1 Tax=Epilithonimonas lactis TaxID=421072 RepID=A0A085BMF9_9FLAO|nr:hypothetical protein [Epilithonimonas lactis]KFC23654.1 hypothetical protein IO89_03500 [Epilithonimonas lactis]SEQ20767.1 hypothetical protein SAMN04488097_1668 [Epilithonimonas lactis]
MIDFSYFYKEKYSFDEIPTTNKYDLLLSAYDGCDRTKKIFDKILAENKKWIIYPHYDISDDVSNSFTVNSFQEDDDGLVNFVKDLHITTDTKICIDITGFLRPHLIYLTLLLNTIYKVKKIDFLYTEPNYYKDAEETVFSGAISEAPRLIKGCSSSKSYSNFDKDILIINAGYDDKLISAVTKDKSKVFKKFIILGFPSLQPDFYQENVFQIRKAKDEIGQVEKKSFAPAYDPFETANRIKEIVEANCDDSNVYLSPLSTKPQTLGLLIYFLWYRDTKSLNIIFPFSNVYKAKTAVGINHTWRYSVELN